MSQRTFIRMPSFVEARQRVGNRRHPQSVIVCRWETRELKSFSATELCPFAEEADTSSALSDVYHAPTGLVRRCRKKSGSAFGPDDIEPTDALTLDEFAASIFLESDHPYSAMLALHDRALPLVPPADTSDFGGDPGWDWRGRIVVIDGEIFVPTLTPTLSVSFDQERGSLVAAASCPPIPSPALRMPTVHLPYDVDAGTLAALARELDVGLEFTAPPEMSPIRGRATNLWINKTLADLYLYLVLKGVRRWPEDLPFNVLSQVYQAVLYAEETAPLEWFGRFLETREGFDPLATYIEALQDLIFARYRVVGDDLPPLPSDELGDF